MKDRPQPLADLPAPTLGAPCPLVAASELTLRLIYHSVTHKDALISVVFRDTFAFRWGPPNDERRIQLADISTPHELVDSSWLQDLIKLGKLAETEEYD